MRWTIRRLPWPMLIVFAACGPQEKPIRDVRVEVPAPDPNFVDFVGGEAVIEPGKEAMLCFHMRWDGGEFAYRGIDVLQGKFGHHAVLLGSLQPLEPLTVEDCTEAADMSKYEIFAAVLGDELPEGKAFSFPASKSMVLQSHYVNTGDVPIRVRDVVRLKKVPTQDVREWASMVIANTLKFEVPPNGPAKAEFDCTVPSDVSLLVTIGHMHENGRRFETQYEEQPGTGVFKSLYKVDPWKPEYRDVPPATLFTTAPLQLKAGAKIRTICEWENRQQHAVRFPEEMCVGVSYATGIKDPFVCSVEK